jgi:hypothetical protein
MKNIHILPTDKPSRLHLTYDKDYYLSIEPFIQLDTKNYKSFNIYITSDEEIKEGDWVFGGLNGIDIKKYGKYFAEDWKKIILTTDQDLIKDGVQEIDDEFLEWFVKNPSCEEVEIFRNWTSVSIFDYVITIPKEEPKQETLEEAAKELYPIEYTGRMFMPNRDELNNSYKQEAFIEGVKSDAARDYWYAKWQQEQDKNKYSEEDMKQFGLYLGDNLKKLKNKSIDEIFEQFKNI